MAMRTFLSLAIASGLAIIPSLASAQALGLDTQFRLGYFSSNRYSTKAGLGATNQGLELDADIPIFPKIPLGPGMGSMQIAFSPGFAAMSGDRGDVYRLLLTAQAKIPTTPLYGRFGVGYAYAGGASSVFGSKSAYEIDYTLGVPILTKLPVFSLGAEITYHQSSQALVGGWTFGISAKF